MRERVRVAGALRRTRGPPSLRNLLHVFILIELRPHFVPGLPHVFILIELRPHFVPGLPHVFILIELRPYFVPGLPHVFAHSRRPSM